MPGGICRRIGCEMAVTCAMAVSMLAPGWKKILTMARPFDGLRLDVLDVVDRGGEDALVNRR